MADQVLDSDQNPLPERVIWRALTIGVTALIANPSLIDAIVGGNLEDPAEIAKARAQWQAHPPVVVQGYARNNQVMPVFAITVSSDANTQDRLGMGDEVWYPDVTPDDAAGERYSRRCRGSFTIYVYSEHPDVTLWYYRICKRILNAATDYLIRNGLDNPRTDGADVMPDPQYIPENLFVRRITLTTEYEETWVQDALWIALNGQPEGAGTQVNVHHEDVPLEEDQPVGDVSPYNVGEED